jgi:hypothetical protein
MTNLKETLYYIENVDIITLMRDVNDHFRMMIKEYGEDVDIRLFSQIQRISNLADILNQMRFDKLQVLLDEQDNQQIEDNSPLFNDSNHKKTHVQKKKNRIKNPCDDMINNYAISHKEDTLSFQEEKQTGDIDFAATILPYKKNYIRELCRKGELPHDQPAGKYIFSRKNLEDWLKHNNLGDQDNGLEIGRYCKMKTRL